MRIKLDRQKCVGCGFCLENCPQLPEKKDLKILSCDGCGECIQACPRNAISRIGGVVVIDKEKCNNCGECVKACRKKAIIMQKKFPGKCDLCIQLGSPACIQACPYNAISVELEKHEEEFIRKNIGWKKIKTNPEKVLENGKNHEVVSTGKELVFLTNKKEVWCEEAYLMSTVLNALREKSEKYDETLVKKLILEYGAENNLILEKSQVKYFADQIEKEVNGFSVLDEFIKTDCLEEIAVINEKKPIYVYHKKYGWLKTDIIINNDKKIISIINRIARSLGRRITLQKPKINACLKFGRMHAAIPPISVSGTSLTIRKFNEKPFTPKDLIKNKTISPEALAFLFFAVQSDMNILIAGNTGSGKTTTLNTVFSFIPLNERIIIIEETPEIMLPHEHQVRLVVNEELGFKMHELVTDSLRMRPDRVIMGEIRSGEEAKAFMNTLLAGQGKSSIATFHAQNSEEALTRMQGLGVSPADLAALDLIIVQKRWTNYGEKTKDMRRITEISSIEFKGKPMPIKLYEYDQGKDGLVRRKIYGTKAFKKICFSFRLNEEKFEKELKKKQETLAVK